MKNKLSDITIESISVLRLKPDDILVMKVGPELLDNYETAAEHVKRYLGIKNKIVLMSNEYSFEILREES